MVGNLCRHFVCRQGERGGRKQGKLLFLLEQALLLGLQLRAVARLLGKGATPAGELTLPALNMLMFLQPLLPLGLRLQQRS